MKIFSLKASDYSRAVLSSVIKVSISESTPPTFFVKTSASAESSLIWLLALFEIYVSVYIMLLMPACWTERLSLDNLELNATKLIGFLC